MLTSDLQSRSSAPTAASTPNPSELVAENERLKAEEEQVEQLQLENQYLKDSLQDITAKFASKATECNELKDQLNSCKAEVSQCTETINGLQEELNQPGRTLGASAE